MNEYRAPWALLPEGWKRDVRIRVASNGTIAAVEADSTGDGATPLGGPVIAGMPNAHSHVLQRALAGRAEGAGRAGDSFWSWRDTMYSFASRVGPDEFEAIATGAYVEMLKAGYTSVAEFHYLHHGSGGKPYVRVAEMSERVIAAASSAGIALTLLPVLYRYSDFGAVAPSQSQARFIMDLDAFEAMWDSLAATTRNTPNVRLGVAAHSLRAVTGDEIGAILDHVDTRDASCTAPIHIHISEQRREVDACLDVHGTTPVELLAASVELGPRWSLVHATHATAGELTRIARAGAAVVVCPTTEANLGDGIFPAASFAAEGGAIALGSDSHVSLDVAEELRWLEYGQRLALQRRHVLGQDTATAGELSSNPLSGPPNPLGESLYARALAAGAQALAQPVGSLTSGRRADFLVLQASEAHPSLDRAIFRSGGWNVRDVFVAGVRLVRDGRHAREEQAFEASAKAARAVLQRRD